MVYNKLLLGVENKLQFFEMARFDYPSLVLTKAVYSHSFMVSVVLLLNCILYTLPALL
jgi:hypothetical protein